jgi:hypothetical protein
MISIRECCDKVEEIEQEHTSFMRSHIEPIIDFYIELFDYMITINRRTNDENINEYVKSISTKTVSRKSLLRPIFKKKEFIKKVSDCKNIKFDNKLKIVRSSLPELVKDLKFLKAELVEILRFKVYDDEDDIVRNKTLYVSLFSDIEMLMPKIFDYKWFIRQKADTEWNPFKLSTMLGMNVCPYCNRQYTFTVSNSNRHTTRPELDHFLPKGEYPLFALSFYNLIPSCTVCNRDLKGSTSFDPTTHFSPYDENLRHEFLKYDYSPLTYEGSVGLSDDITLKLKINNSCDESLSIKLESNMKVFKYNDIAIHHRDVAQEIIRKRAISEDRYIQILQETFPNANLTLEEAYRYAYGNFYNEKDFGKRPLAKLTKDIAINVGSIHPYKDEK